MEQLADGGLALHDQAVRAAPDGSACDRGLAGRLYLDPVHLVVLMG